jgi:hypothetical protein
MDFFSKNIIKKFQIIPIQYSHGSRFRSISLNKFGTVINFIKRIGSEDMPYYNIKFDDGTIKRLSQSDMSPFLLLVESENKIIYSNKQEETDFINNNQIRKDSFEKIYNKWIEYSISRYGKIRIRLPNLIEKYKDSLDNIDGKYFSKKPIFYTSNDIFELFKNEKFSILLNNNEVVAIAAGIIWPDCFYISKVRSNIKGGCSSIISKLLESWWDKDKLQFSAVELNKDPPVKLHVLEDNLPAVGCYKKFGFKMTDEILNGEKVMILTKESYAENYLLPLYENKLTKK